MHPIPEDELAAHLRGGLPHGALSDHLRACPECAGRLETLAAWDRALSLGEEREEVDLQPRLAGRHPELFRKAFPWQWAAAAGLLIAVGLGLSLREPRKPEPVRPSSPLADAWEAGDRLRLLAPEPGVEFALGMRSRLARQEGRWVLTRGSCLVFAQERKVTFSAGDLEVGIRDAEVLVRLPRPALAWLGEALAEEAAPVEVVVLSGQAELRTGIRRLTLSAGEGWMKGARRPVAAAPLREAFFAAPESKGQRILDGAKGQNAWVEAPPGGVYQASFRLRALDKPSAFGVNVEAGGQNSFWDLRDPGLLDGAWHGFRVTVSPGWVTLTVDGVPRLRVAREGFKPNPLTGVSGVGAVVWGGRLEVSGFRADSLE